jgi:hypothetical protein
MLMNRYPVAVTAAISPGHLLVLVLLLMPVVPGNVHAELYKWVDEQGTVHYSDEDPKKNVKSKTTIDPEATRHQKAEQRANAKTAILLPNQKNSRYIVLSNVDYQWKQPKHSSKKTKLGAYFIGQHCSPRGPIESPAVYPVHGNFFPSEFSLALSMNNFIARLGYRGGIATRQDIGNRLRRSSGVYLKAEIIDLELEVCAPVRDSKRYLDPHKLRARKFTKNRAKLSVRWKMFQDLAQAPIFDRISNGYVDNWSARSGVNATLKQAFENAAVNLFADQGFVAQLLVDGEPQQPAPRSFASNTGTQPGLTGSSGGSITNKLGSDMMFKARLAQVMGEVSSVKVYMMEHYMSEGSWPLTKEEIGLSDSMFDRHPYISGLTVKYDGSINVELNSIEFGTNRILKLVPDTEAYRNHRSLGMEWKCFCNLPRHLLPGSCESI